MKLQLIILVILICLVFSPSAQAQAGSYSFTLIADSSGPLNTFSSATVSSTGNVAFIAYRDAGGQGVFTGSGGALTTLIDTSGAFGTFYSFRLLTQNGPGTVAFEAHTPSGPSNVYTVSGGSITPIATSIGSVWGLSINDPGVVAFVATVPGSTHGLHTGSGGSLTLVDTGHNYFSGPHINNNGTIAFGRGVQGCCYGLFTRNPFSQLRQFGAMSDGAVNINDVGVFAFYETEGLGSYVTRIYIENGGQRTTVAETGAGFYSPVGTFNSLFTSNINNSPQVVFFGLVNNGEEPTCCDENGGEIYPTLPTGVFNGPSPVSNKIIATGDSLFGSTVLGVEGISNAALNDNGQVAFIANLADGRQVVGRATPVL